MEPLTFGGYYEQNKDDDRTHTRMYGVQITMEQQNNTDTIQFMMQTTCHKNENSYLWEVTLQKSALQVNHKKPRLFKTAYDLMFSTQVLYPITVMVAPNGSIHTITDISYTQVQKRFSQFKQAILQESTGVQITQYLDSLAQGIDTKKKLLRYLKSDWFWAIYFQTIYTAIDPVTSLVMPIDHTLGSATYNGRLSIEKSLSYYNTRQHIFTGAVAPSFLAQHLSIPYDKVTMDSTYDFEKDTGVLKHATAIQHCKAGKSDSKTTIHLYHLSEKDAEITAMTDDTKEEQPSIFQKMQQILQWL
ncbi:hypothetical protein [Aquimarina aquimarini]|uniref:hypothetical protein n=1 Tax=Aquimarina aquimarini TaxID=1191734 RepID=UPI000D54D2B3|nr:hypothetical protein [Aquimarina aquimarini]